MSRRPITSQLLLAATACLAVARPAFAADLDTIKARMLSDAVSNASFKAETEEFYGTDFTQAQSYLSSMAANGSWSDIDYGDKSNLFPPLKHLDRMLVWSYVYNKPSEALYKSSALLAALNKALGYWYQVNPTCTNWYMNDIGKQFYLGPIGLLMQAGLDAASFSKLVNDLSATATMTGANKTAFATSMIYRAVLENSTSRLASGVTALESVIAYTSGDGVQRDNSFQQHGGILYNGNYGFAFLRDVTWVGSMVAGTSYALPATNISLLRDNFLEGTRWMIRGGLVDYNVRGRQVGALLGPQLLGDIFLPVLDRFMIIDAANKAAYQTARDAISNAQPQAVSGARHFWSSDYTAVQRPAYFASVKMCSKRTIGMERNVNTENLMGYWLPYGLTYTIRRGDEFNYIFPVLDWARLPGVTNPHVEISWADDPTTYTSQTTTFVGAASDGAYAATAMDFSLQQTTAKKSWFWFDREWVALGAGISSTHAKSIVTSVQQVLQKGDVLADGSAFTGAAKALSNPKWVLHDGVGYVFPEPQTVQIQATPQSGSVQRIYGLGSAATVSSPVFSLWFDHGTAPSGKTYQYVVLPGTDAASLDAYAKALPLTVLSNTASIQAVTHKTRLVTGAVFFQAGSVSVSGGPSVKVDVPSIVVLNEPAGTVAVSDPSASESRVNVTITNVSGSSKTQAVSLPSGDSAGKSVIITGLLDRRAALDGGAGAGGAVGGSPGNGAGGATPDANGGASGGAVEPSRGGSAGLAATAGASAGGGLTAAGGVQPIGGSGVTPPVVSNSNAGGCSCSTAPAPSSRSPITWLLLAGGAFALRRRKTRSYLIFGGRCLPRSPAFRKT